MKGISAFVEGFSVSVVQKKSRHLAATHYSEGKGKDRKEAGRRKYHTEDKFSALD